MSQHLCTKYLARYGCPEGQIGGPISAHTWTRVLVVPAHCEEPNFIEDYREALETHADEAGGRVLVIVVVNASEDHSEAVADHNRTLVQALCDRLAGVKRLREVVASAWIGSSARYDVLIVDRCSPGCLLPAGEGVGLARKIGCDLALALQVHGQVRSRWIHTTDADARLPPDYFAMTPDCPGSRARVEGIPGDSRRVAACVYPYWHLPTGEPHHDRAVGLYEIYLRHYSLGLWSAASAWAFPTIGSLICVDTQAYAAVRGVPRRLAGEDFHFLAKLAKVGPIAVIEGPPVLLSGRPSNRTPFGTGTGVMAIADALGRGETMNLPHPGAFVALAGWNRMLRELPECREPSAGRAQRYVRGGSFGPELDRAAQQLGAYTKIDRAVADSPRPQVLHTRLHIWFDALKTLRLLHGLRDAGLADIPWWDALVALAQAPSLEPTVWVDCPLADLKNHEYAWRLWLAGREGVTGLDPLLTEGCASADDSDRRRR